VPRAVCGDERQHRRTVGRQYERAIGQRRCGRRICLCQQCDNLGANDGETGAQRRRRRSRVSTAADDAAAAATADAATANATIAVIAVIAFVIAAIAFAVAAAIADAVTVRIHDLCITVFIPPIAAAELVNCSR
jgi:hypothetical protein